MKTSKVAINDMSHTEQLRNEVMTRLNVFITHFMYRQKFSQHLCLIQNVN